ncbi:MAG: OmpA family protein [Cyclobacteriaceae bacterium]
MKLKFLLVVSVLSNHFLLAQSAFFPKNLGSSINSTYDDINPVITPDGKTLFFVRVNHPENSFGIEDSEDIWFANALSDSTWSSAKRVPYLNIARYNAVLSVSSNGKAILLNGVFNKRGTLWKKRGLSISLKQGKEWGIPEPLRVRKLEKRNGGLQSSGSMSADGQTIFLSFGKTYNTSRTDLYVIEKKGNGKWTKPKKIKALNSKANEDAPFLSPNGKTIYFSSNRNRGQYNIYKSNRTGSDWKNWSSPQPLSDTINTNAWESYFRTTKNGGWAYFSSTNKSLGKADIYKVKLFEENPFVIVKGKILNAKNQAPLVQKNFAISANGKPIDSIKINFDSATYKAKLPLGKIYQLSALLTNFNPESQTLDVTKKKEFGRKNIDLLLDPIPFVIVRGKLLVQNTGLPLPTAANPRIFINNIQNDSIKIDAHAASYEMKINHGAVYDVKLAGDHFDALPRKLDLSKVNEFQEMTLDLYVAEETMATISGKIIDKKTGKPLVKSKSAKIIVEGLSNATATIDSLQSAYELKLPLGSQFSISASIPDYFPTYEKIDTRGEKSAVKIYKDLIVEPVEVGESIRLNNIFFDIGKTTLKSESFPELDRAVEFLESSPDIRVEVGGHTDNVGNASANQKLSQGRAQAVADYIVSKGISQERVVAKGYGLSKPVASNATQTGRSQNRRVEFTILGK